MHEQPVLGGLRHGPREAALGSSRKQEGDHLLAGGRGRASCAARGLASAGRPLQQRRQRRQRVPTRPHGNRGHWSAARQRPLLAKKVRRAFLRRLRKGEGTAASGARGTRESPSPCRRLAERLCHDGENRAVQARRAGPHGAAAWCAGPARRSCEPLVRHAAVPAARSLGRTLGVA